MHNKVVRQITVWPKFEVLALLVCQQAIATLTWSCIKQSAVQCWTSHKVILQENRAWSS